LYEIWLSVENIDRVDELGNLLLDSIMGIDSKAFSNALQPLLKGDETKRLDQLYFSIALCKCI
jgi:hypothetical protein